MSLPYIVSSSAVTAVQANAAQCAAVTSSLLGHRQLSAPFCNLACLLSKRLELTSDFEASHACQTHCNLVLRMRALRSFPKPGSYSVAQALDMVSIAETISHPERAHLRETVQQELKKHDTWSQDLKLSLQR